MLRSDIKMQLDLDVIAEKVEPLMRDIADAVFAKSQEYVPVDTGELADSGDVRRVGPMEYQIFYDAPHAVKIEYGGVPESVSFEALHKWAKRNAGRFGLKGNKQIRGFAAGVKKKIEARGVSPQPFLRPAVDEIDIYEVERIKRRYTS